MILKWASRKKYLSTWNDEILTPLQNLVFGQLNLNNNKIDLLVFKELKFVEELAVADSTGSKLLNTNIELIHRISVVQVGTVGQM